jgi:3-hydroxyisobutyrate dehydrogenase-like beta-hydroxyacid dehydrogenase
MIGFIGLGTMGEPMCRNLATRGGEQVCAFDIAKPPLERLQAHGVVAVASIRELAERCSMVFLSLPGGEELKRICAGPGSLLLFLRAGSTVVDLSTSPVTLTRELHERFSARGVHFADAPVARTREAAEKGTLSVMVGATETTFKRIRPLLANMASDITHCGPPGSGQAMKILNNMVLFQNVVALAEALAVARASGIDPKLTLEVLAKGSADSFALRNHGMKAMLPGEFPERAFSVEYALKDLGYALELAAQAKLELTGARNARSLLRKAAADGHGKQYFPVVAKVIGSSGSV